MGNGGAAGNLFQPVEERAATHGSFDDRAREVSGETWASIHRGAVWAGAGAAAALTLSGLLRLSGGRRPGR